MRAWMSAALAACVAPCSWTAGASEWTHAAGVAASTEYDSNPALTSDATETALLLRGDLDARASWRWARSELTLSPRLVVRRYSGDYGLDSEDVYVDLGYRRRNELGETTASASYIRDDTLTSEFISTGFVEANVPRERAAVRTGLERLVSERTVAAAELAWERTNYVGGDSVGLVDFDYASALGYARTGFTARTGGSMVARVARLSASTLDQDSLELTLGLGLDHRWNERWRASVSAGPSYSETDGTSNGINPSLRVEVDGAWPRATLSLQAQRQLSPLAGRGVLETRDAASVGYDFRLRERWTLLTSLSVALFSAADDPRNRGGDYRSYVDGGATLRWQQSARSAWRLSCSYAHREEDDDSARGYRVNLGFEWRARELSRWL